MRILPHLLADRTSRRGELDGERNIFTADLEIFDEAKRDDVSPQVRVFNLCKRTKNFFLCDCWLSCFPSSFLPF